MNLPSTPTRKIRLIVLGSLFVAFFAGSACSRDALLPDISMDHRGDSLPSFSEPPPVKGGSEHVQTLGKNQRLDDSLSSCRLEHRQPVDSDSASSDLDKGDDTQLEKINRRVRIQLDEILSLYRRLHIELDDAGRSALIVDLFDDPRLEIRHLGFELTDRDLSSNTVLAPEVSDAAKRMLQDQRPEIRARAARLITRLIPPDAMMVLTASLAKETDPIAAEPMLMGIARWPSPEAVEPVLLWFLRADSPFVAASSAVWSIEQAGYWDSQRHHPILLARLRAQDPKDLRDAGMKLIARLGDASDLRMLMSLLLAEDQNQQQWAASALVETPRSVELLVQAAEENDRLFKAASDSLIRHRATPEGLRRLVSLPYPDEHTRRDAIVRMGASLEDDRLAEAVRLAGLDSQQTILLLKRLLNGDIEMTPRVAKGIILLAQTELDGLRPNRAFEAAIALDGVSLDPADQSKIISIKAVSLILLGKFSEAFEISTDSGLWLKTIGRTPDVELRKRIGLFILESSGDALSTSRIAEIRSASGLVERPGASTKDPLDSPIKPSVEQND